MKSVNVAVMALNAFGNPVLPTYSVQCTDEEYNLGLHLDRAIDLASQEGHDTFHAFVAEDQAAQMLLGTAAFLGYVPKVAIFMEGGLVTSVIADTAVEWGIVDYDTEGAGDDDIVDIPQGDGTTSEAYVCRYDAEVQPDRVNEVFLAIGGSDSLNHVPETELFDLCTQLGIQLLEASEETSGGWWDWVDGDKTSDISHESKQLAAIDALGYRFPVRSWKGAAPEKDYLSWIKEEAREILELV